jgi:hypothetical protein
MSEEQRLPWVNVTFASVVVVACIPQKALLLIWALSTSICCPLIVAVIPGLFYYRVLKQNEVEKDVLRKCGLVFAGVGMLAIPLFVTLTTKNIFMETLPT